MKKNIQIPRHIIDTKDFKKQVQIAKHFFVHEIEWLVPVFSFPSNPDIYLYRSKSTAEIKDLFVEEDIKQADKFYNIVVKGGLVILVEFNDPNNSALVQEMDIPNNSVFTLFPDDADQLTDEEKIVLDVLSVEEVVGRQLN